MHGRVPRLPIEVQLGIPDVTNKVTTMSYVRRLQEHLSRAFEIARDCSGAAASKSKFSYDRKTRFNRLEVGDLVMVKVNAFHSWGMINKNNKIIISNSRIRITIDPK